MVGYTLIFKYSISGF